MVVAEENNKRRCAKEFYMIKKNFFGISILLIGIMLAFALTGCDGNGDLEPPPNSRIPSNPGGDPSNPPGSDPTSINITVTNTDQWNAALTTISNGGNGTAANPKAYTITVNGNVMVEGRNIFTINNSFGSVSHISVTINGNGKLYILGQGCLLSIGLNQTVIINSANLTLEGLKAGQNGSTLNNIAPVILVSGGRLEMRNGTISGNSGGSGVQIVGNGTISGNTATIGGGVDSRGNSFNMSGGIIRNNTAGVLGGGGVQSSVIDGKLTGGTISNNTTTGSGGGLYVTSLPGSSFTVSDGTISGNSASGSVGGGVLILGTGIFTKSGGGVIYGNNAGIDSNTAGSSGHAVHWNSATSTTRSRNATLSATENISTISNDGWD
jgi:hypothetical protein